MNILDLLVVILISFTIMDTSNAKHGYVKTMKGWDIILTPVEEHKYSIIWMHGLGDSANGFLDFFYSSNPVVPN